MYHLQLRLQYEVSCLVREGQHQPEALNLPATFSISFISLSNLTDLKYSVILTPLKLSVFHIPRVGKLKIPLNKFNFNHSRTQLHVILNF